MMSLASISLKFLYSAIVSYTSSLFFFFLKKKRLTEFLFITGFIFHTISQVSRGWFIGIFTPNAMFEEVFFLPWCLACLVLGLRLFSKDKDLIYTTLVLIFLFSVIAFIYPKGIFPPFPKVKTIFSPLFFFFEVFAHACFILGAWFAFWYLRGKEHARIFHSFVIWGFILYSLAQVVGAILVLFGLGCSFQLERQTYAISNLVVFLCCLCSSALFTCLGYEEKCPLVFSRFITHLIFKLQRAF